MNAPWLPPRPSAADEAARQLLGEGYCILRALVPPAEVAALSADFDARFERIGRCDGYFFGHSTKRFHALLTRSQRTAGFVLNPVILDLIDRALLPHCDRVQLNLTQAIEILPGERAQAPHRDQDMWQRPVAGIEYLVNVMWPLSPFTRENGATRLWPGTNHDLAERRVPMSEAAVAEMEPGDALLYLGSVVHGAGANRSAVPRRGMVISYALGWLKQFENMSLTYPPHVARHFPRQLTDLIGYRRHNANLGSYDGNCPSRLLDGETDFLAATENMTSEQEAILEHFAAHQDWS